MAEQPLPCENPDLNIEAALDHGAGRYGGADAFSAEPFNQIRRQWPRITSLAKKIANTVIVYSADEKWITRNVLDPTHVRFDHIGPFDITAQVTPVTITIVSTLVATLSVQSIDIDAKGHTVGNHGGPSTLNISDYKVAATALDLSPSTLDAKLQATVDAGIVGVDLWITYKSLLVAADDYALYLNHADPQARSGTDVVPIAFDTSTLSTDGILGYTVYALQHDAKGHVIGADSGTPGSIDLTTAKLPCNCGCPSGSPEVTPALDSSAVSLFEAGADYPAGTYRVVYLSGSLDYGDGFQRLNNVPTSLRAFYVQYDNGASEAVGPGDSFTYASTALVELNNRGKYLEFDHVGGTIGVYLKDDDYSDNTAGDTSPLFQLCLTKLPPPPPPGSPCTYCADTTPAHYVIQFSGIDFQVGILSSASCSAETAGNDVSAEQTVAQDITDRCLFKATATRSPTGTIYSLPAGAGVTTGVTPNKIELTVLNGTSMQLRLFGSAALVGQIVLFDGTFDFGGSCSGGTFYVENSITNWTITGTYAGGDIVANLGKNGSATITPA